METLSEGSSFNSDFENTFGVSLSKRIETLLNSGDREDFAEAIELIEALLFEAGVEIDPIVKKRLKELLRDHGRLAF